jgi:polyisoprenoid-binding protein YceI
MRPSISITDNSSLRGWATPRFLTTVAALIITGSLAVPALAQTAPPPAAPASKPAAPAVQGGAYQVEPDHTQVVFSLSHLGFTHYDGIFSGASGNLKLV